MFPGTFSLCLPTISIVLFCLFMSLMVVKWSQFDQYFWAPALNRARRKCKYLGFFRSSGSHLLSSTCYRCSTHTSWHLLAWSMSTISRDSLWDNFLLACGSIGQKCLGINAPRGSPQSMIGGNQRLNTPTFFHFEQNNSEDVLHWLPESPKRIEP